MPDGVPVSLRPRARPVRPPFFGRDDVFLVTGEEATAFDERAMAPPPEGVGVPAGVLMESAGRAAAAVVDRLVPRGPVVVLAGGGGNGGDGVVMARSLHAVGRDVLLRVVADRPHPDPLLHGHPVEVHRGPTPEPGELARAAVVVDAVLGIGVRGAVRAPLDGLLHTLERLQAGNGPTVVSLDLPSGVEAGTGQVHGPAARADVTLAFGAAKLGSLLGEGRSRTGRLVVLDIGFPPWPPAAASARLLTPGWAARRHPIRAPDAHKKSSGRLLLLAGSPGMAGAAVLAARAALRAGVGYLQVVADDELRPLLQEAVPEALVVDPQEACALLSEVDAVAAGPGLGTDPSGRGGEILRDLLVDHRLPGAVLLDADALTLLAGGHLHLPGPASDGGRAGEGREVLLTPHPGEMARLEEGFGVEGSEDPPLPHLRARAMARRLRVTCLLKGMPTVVATALDDSPVLVAPTSSPRLARAGMGDVLTGVAAALLARGLPAPDAAGLALHLTGRAAEGAGSSQSLLPSDVVEALPRSWDERGDGETELPRPWVLFDRPPPP